MTHPPTITVVGCGVNGLTCGIALLEAGYRVNIVADKLPAETVSAIAPAVWFPYKVQPMDKALRWAELTRVKLMALAEQFPTIGIYELEMWELFHEPIETIWWADSVPGFQRLTSAERPNTYPDGAKATVPMIESPLYLPWLLRHFVRSGGELSLLNEPLTDLRELETDAEIIVNCVGIGAATLCKDDDIYPLRGLLAVVKNPGLHRVLIAESAENITYIIPRRDDVILGGTADKGVWDDTVDEALLERIVARCHALAPILKDAELIEYRAGLRPGRTVVRLEAEQLSAERTVIHNYGHGGAGYTLSWGCAFDVVALANQQIDLRKI